MVKHKTHLLIISENSENFSLLSRHSGIDSEQIIQISSFDEFTDKAPHYIKSAVIIDTECAVSAYLEHLKNSFIHHRRYAVLTDVNSPQHISIDPYLSYIDIHRADLETLSAKISQYPDESDFYEKAFQCMLDLSEVSTVCLDTNLTILAAGEHSLNGESDSLIGLPAETVFPEQIFGQLKRQSERISADLKSLSGECIFNSAVYETVLSPIVSGGVISAYLFTFEKKDEESAEKYDQLTGLASRITFSDFLEKAISRASRHERILALCCINLDNFKAVNNELGHDFGDFLLRTASNRISGAIRSSDFAARIGADEFGVILDEMARPEDAAQVAQKLLDLISEPYINEGIASTITASIGISFFSGGTATREELFKTADIAMLHAKESGRNRYRFFSLEMQEKALHRMRLEKDLRQAVSRQELELYYQPQIDAKTMKVTALEALIRWKHHDLGMISPAEFIPLAEETRLINSIGDWVIQNAAQGDHEWWKERGVTIPKLTVAINVSAQQLKDDNFGRHVEELIHQSGLDPRSLEIEITETALIEDPESAIRTLEYIRNLGISIAIDDFGTGYSSLSYIRKLPADILKVDLSFVRDIGKDPKTEAIILSTISLAHNLGLRVVAEGVETEEQMLFLRNAGCDIFQGYYFSKPLPADELVRYLHTAWANSGV